MQEKYYRVDMLESEAGWGSRIDEVFYYKNQEDALEFVNRYNAEYNNQKTTPSWYIMACSPVEVNDFGTVTNLNQYFNYHFDEKFCKKADITRQLPEEYS